MSDVTVKQIPLDGPEMAALYRLRERVLRPGRPPEASRYDNDAAPDSIHLGAFDEAGRLVGIATLLNEDGIRLRGMAVEPDLQQGGVGAAIIRHAQRIATEANEDLWCHARSSARGFYEKMGWWVKGDEFVVPTVGPHFIMRWQSAANP